MEQSKKTLADHLIDVRHQLDEAAKGAGQQIRGGSDNPAITRLSAASFTMSSKNLGNSWSPFFHDWAAQYKRLAELVEAQKFYAISQIIDTGKLKASSTSKSKEEFAPQVVDRLKAIVGNLPVALFQAVDADALQGDQGEPAAAVSARPRLR